VQPSLDLAIDEVGLFILSDNNVALPESYLTDDLLYTPVANAQSFYKYDFVRNMAFGHFSMYPGIATMFYDSVSEVANEPITEIARFDAQAISDSYYRDVSVMQVDSFSPNRVTAGTAETIVINGSGFGDSRGSGSVGFADANNGGASFFTPLANQYVSWSDTQIVVEVPDRAGTGSIRVITSGGVTFNPAESLQITHAEINIESNANGTMTAYSSQHANDNGEGGYFWQFHTDFDLNVDAKASFMSSLESWRCASGVNWKIGEVSPIDVVAGDGVNIVRFDNGNELPAGVLGRATTRSSGCFVGGSLNWFASELDIVFDDDAQWHYGTDAPAAGLVDFESVATHELGHAHYLGHVINRDEVMHYSLSRGVAKRSPSENELAGALNVQSRSENNAVCGADLMTRYQYGPSSTVTANCISSQTIDINAQNNNQWHDLFDSDGALLASIHPMGNALGEVQANTSISAEPVQTEFGLSSARSTEVNVEVQPTSPVRVKMYYAPAELDDILPDRQELTSLSFYKNNQNCGDQFDGTGLSLTPIDSGTFSCNSDYFLEFEISEFSSFFAVSPDAPLLPVELSNFSAFKRGDDAVLQWSTATESNNDGFEIEFSRNGIDFQTIGEVLGAGTTSEPQSYEFTHQLIGRAGMPYGYYRLRQLDYDGTSQVSTLKILSWSAKNVLTVFPNPAIREGSISVVGKDISEYKIYDNMGRVVQASSDEDISDAKLIQLDKIRASGIYYLVLSDGRSSTILVR